MHFRARFVQSGFTMIEIAVVVLVILLLSGIAFRIPPPCCAQFGVVGQRIAGAIVKYAFDWGRLPCPDTDGDGVENCIGSPVVGNIPWVTLGIDPKELAQPNIAAVYQPHSSLLSSPPGGGTDFSENMKHLSKQLAIVTASFVGTEPYLATPQSVDDYGACTLSGKNLGFALVLSENTNPVPAPCYSPNSLRGTKVFHYSPQHLLREVSAR